MVFPFWFAAITTVPEPLRVMVLFAVIVAGPLFTLSSTGKPLVEVGTDTTNGAEPAVLFGIGDNAEIV